MELMDLKEIIKRYYIINEIDEERNNKIRIDAKFISNYLAVSLNRFKHIEGVVSKMSYILARISNIRAKTKEKLINIAYLHDIGYSEKLTKSGFHPLDGAIFAIENGFDDIIVKSVLFHTGAAGEAALRGGYIAETYKNINKLLCEEDMFWIGMISYCDLHTDSIGRHITLEKRIGDVFRRYAAEDIVYKNIKNNLDYFREIELRVENLCKE